MAGKRATPEQIAQIITLREAGYTSAMIVEKIGLSIPTVKRICATNSVKKGRISQELIDQARQDLVERITGENAIKEMSAKLIADNLAINTVIREKVLDSIEHLNPSDTVSAALCLRACTAAATSVKASTDSIKSLLNLEHLQENNDDLPELTVTTMTDLDVADMRFKQEQERREAMGIYADETEEVDIIEVA